MPRYALYSTHVILIRNTFSCKTLCARVQARINIFCNIINALIPSIVDLYETLRYSSTRHQTLYSFIKRAMLLS